MRCTITIAFSLLFSISASAANLCDSACEFNSAFLNGGSIDATEPLTITFGSGGFVNDGATTTGKANGETMVLTTGQSMLFGAGGELELGVGGNIDYTSMSLSGGVHTINADTLITITQLNLSDAASLQSQSDIVIVDGGKLSVDNSASILMTAGSLTINGGVDIGGNGSLLIGVDPTNNDTCNFSAISSTLSISNSNVGTLSDPCADISTIINSGTFSIDNNLLAQGDIQIVGVTSLTISPITGGTLSIGPLTVANLTTETLANFEGALLATADNENCTVTNGECLSASGARYVVVGGELVLADDAEGSLALLSFILLLSTLLLMRHYNSLRIR